MDENQSTDTTQENDHSWDIAATDFLEDKGVEIEKNQEQEDDKQTDTTQPPADGSDADASKGGNADEGKKSDDNEEESDSKNDDSQQEENYQEDSTIRDQRAIQREIEADRTQTRQDVREKLYSDWSDNILDEDGDPIKTPADVMKYVNPATKQRFTEEEATAWLFAAQKHKDQQRAEMEQRVEKVAEANITVRDDIDAVRSKFGQILKDMPDLRKAIWEDYQATLVTDPDTGLILDAPISFQRFAERALQPYADYAARLQAEAPQQQPTAAAQQKQTVQDTKARKQAQSDREDIYSAGKGDMTDPEEKEWADVAKQYYEG